MAAVAMTHTAHAVTGSFAGLNARSTTDTLHRARVAFANVTGTVAVNAGAFAVNAAALAMDAGAFVMDGLSILRVQRCLARPMGVAHDPAEVEPVVVSYLSPAFPSLVQCYKIVETLARFVSQQVCSLQFTPAKPRRSSLRLQITYGNAGLIGNSRQHRSARRNAAQQQEECRCD